MQPEKEFEAISRAEVFCIGNQPKIVFILQLHHPNKEGGLLVDFNLHETAEIPTKMQQSLKNDLEIKGTTILQ